MNPEPVNDDAVFSASEVARRLGISVQAVTKRIKRGTLRARKEGSRYVVLGTEVNRLLNRESRPLNPEPLSPQLGSSEPESRRVQGVTPDADTLIERLREQVVSAEQQVEVYRGKLESSERENEAIRGERELLRSDVEHLRKMNTQLGDTLQNLAEEIKGLTIALHYEQGQRRELPAHLDDTKAETKRKATKSGFFSRMFRRKRIARVGPPS